MQRKSLSLLLLILCLSSCQSNPRVADKIGTLITLVLGGGNLLLLLIPLILCRNSPNYESTSFSRILGVIFLIFSGIGLITLCSFAVMMISESVKHNFWDLAFYNLLIFVLPACLFYYCVSNWKPYKAPPPENDLYKNLISDGDDENLYEEF